MTKPKYTPDSPPVSLSPEISSWLMDQFNRISDWWPKDFQTRIEALELRTPVKAGTFPIETNVTFNVEGVLQSIVPTHTVAMIFDVDTTYTNPDGYTDNFTGGSAYAGTYGGIVQGADGTLAHSIGNLVYYSTDGQSWTSSDCGCDSGSVVSGLVFSTTDGYWYAAYRYTTGAGMIIVKTADFSSWSTVYSSATGNYPDYTLTHQMATDGSGHFVLATNTGVAPTQTPYFSYSTDYGVTWTHQASEANYTPYYIWYLNGIWFATGKRNVVWRSSNGTTTWTKYYYDSNQFHYTTSMGYGNGRYLALTNNAGGSFDLLYSPEPGNSWSILISFYENVGPFQLAYDATWGWLFAYGTNCYYSTDDGATWSAVPGTYSGLQGCAIVDIVTPP